MDGKGRATDNIWIERFWKALNMITSIWILPTTDWNCLRECRNTSNIITRKNINQQRKGPMMRIRNQSLKKQL